MTIAYFDNKALTIKLSFGKFISSIIKKTFIALNCGTLMYRFIIVAQEQTFNHVQALESFDVNN